MCVPPNVTRLPQTLAAEDAGDGGADTADVFAGDDPGVDAGEEQGGELPGVPEVVDGGVVGAEEGFDDVPQPAAVAVAAGPLPAFGAGLGCRLSRSA